MPTIQCKHVDLKKYKDRSIYIYDIGSNQKLWLCPDCHMILAGKIMQQLATEVFLDTSDFEDKYKEGDKDVRKRRKSKQGRRKKSKD